MPPSASNTIDPTQEPAQDPTQDATQDATPGTACQKLDQARRLIARSRRKQLDLAMRGQAAESALFAQRARRLASAQR